MIKTAMLIICIFVVSTSGHATRVSNDEITSEKPQNATTSITAQLTQWHATLQKLGKKISVYITEFYKFFKFFIICHLIDRFSLIFFS